jgi:hypothetical protein
MGYFLNDDYSGMPFIAFNKKKITMNFFLVKKVKAGRMLILYKVGNHKVINLYLSLRVLAGLKTHNVYRSKVYLFTTRLNLYN